MSFPLRGTPVYQLAVKQPFDSLDHDGKIYSHYLARAAWHGSRISLWETSQESPLIFDLILDLYHACEGKWDTIMTQCGVTRDELEAFLEYAGTFLSHLGNVYDDGLEKIVPELSAEALKRIASISPKTTADLEKVIDGLLAVRPPRQSSLGASVGVGLYPREAVYQVRYSERDRILSTLCGAQEDVVDGFRVGVWSNFQSNTQLQRVIDDNGKAIYQILLASELGACNAPHKLAEDIWLMRGAHSEQLSHICNLLNHAKKWVAKEQHATLDHYLHYFRTGHDRSLQAAQETSTSERIEGFLGFVNPFCNWAGEWNGVVGIVDQDEQSKFNQIVNISSVLIRQLPWAVPGVNDGKGPFETVSFNPPRLSRLHTLAMCGRITFQDAKPDRFHEDRWICHMRNSVFANHLNVDPSSAVLYNWLSALDREHFRRSIDIVRSITTAVHMSIGHGTGKLLGLRVEGEGRCSFDEKMAPISPLTGKPITSFYSPGTSWEWLLPGYAKSLEECRATLVSEYLMDSKEILAIFGYSETSELTPEDLLYTTYLKICVDGIQALQYYGVKDRCWPSWETDRPVAEANYTILKYLLQNGSGVIKITHNREASTITASVDRTKMLSHGKPALGDYLLHLHIWRCTADETPCEELYKSLSTVDGIYEEWREIVSSKQPARPVRRKFVQPNTFLTVDNEVELRVYEESNEGIIKSWAEREEQAEEEKIQWSAKQNTRDKEEAVETMVERDVKPKMENLSLGPGRGMISEETTGEDNIGQDNTGEDTGEITGETTEENTGQDNTGEDQPRAGVRASVKSFVQRIVHRK